MKNFILLNLCLCLCVMSACRKDPKIDTAAAKVALGRKIFFDKNLSNPIGQSCSSCHAPETAFSDLNHNAVSPGAVDGLFGNRNAPTISYAMYTPSFHYSADDSGYAGGLFLDGRANTLEIQAQKPFLNPLEMNNTDAQMLVNKVKAASYYGQYQQLYGDITDVTAAFNNIADALAAFERSAEVNPFSSKYDYYLKGQATLTAEEQRGLILFQDTLRAQCANCHLTSADPTSGMILFTDHTYNSDGVPKNPNNPYYTISSAFNPQGMSYRDLGLGAILNDRAHDGEFKVPTLRNIALTAPYFHNGVFNTLEDVVHFYNTRDSAGSFALAEVTANIDSAETGNLHLSAQEEKDIVAFLKTLTDGYK